MKVIKTKKVKGCLEGKNVHDILVDTVVNKDFVNYLENYGKLIYHDSFDKPFYKVIVRGKFTIQGSEGNKTIRTLLPENEDQLLDEVKEVIEKYGEETDKQ